MKNLFLKKLELRHEKEQKEAVVTIALQKIETFFTHSDQKQHTHTF
jgi:hypothetical protein